MQLRALIYFNELARHGSMRRAAEKLGIAPTAISRQIENLEYHFGAPLVERDPTGIRLTAAGELLAARSARSLRELDHVRTLIDDLKGLRAGRVTVYASGAAASGLLVPALAEFSASYPDVRFEVVVASVGRSMQALADGEADLAVTLFTPLRTETVVRGRVAIEHAAVMAPGHPLADRLQVGPGDLLATRSRCRMRPSGSARPSTRRCGRRACPPSIPSSPPAPSRSSSNSPAAAGRSWSCRPSACAATRRRERW